MHLRASLLAAALLCAAGVSSAQTLPSGFHRTDPITGRNLPTGVYFAHDGRVFVSVFGGAKKRKASMAALDSASGFVQGRLARELSMKRTPQLTFEYDPSVEYGVRMTKLIDELVPDPPPDDATDDSSAD